MGRPKALLPLNGLSLLEAHLAVLSEQCERVVVVGGAIMAPFEKICAAAGAQLIHNPDWASTMPFDSLRCALALGLSTPCVVTPVDTPPVAAEDLSRLLAVAGAAVLGHAGKPGHPVVLGDAELALEGNSLRDLLEGAPLISSKLQDCLLNFNHPEDWQAWLNR
jgi:CTP:molybdopterin cytidylyltransferase MocA